VLGEALTGGFHPAGAFLGSREVMAGLPPGFRPSPQAGSPLACAVATTALDVLVEERLADRSAELGAYFLARLRAMEHPAVREIRGLGLWAELELAGPAAPQCDALVQQGLLCQGIGATRLRLSPPLVISREQLDWAVEKLETVLD